MQKTLNLTRTLHFDNHPNHERTLLEERREWVCTQTSVLCSNTKKTHVQLAHTHLEEKVAQVVDDDVLFPVLRGVPPSRRTIRTKTRKETDGKNTLHGEKLNQRKTRPIQTDQLLVS